LNVDVDVNFGVLHRAFEGDTVEIVVRPELGKDCSKMEMDVPVKMNQGV
jgi:hypothetical protein